MTESQFNELWMLLKEALFPIYVIAGGMIVLSLSALSIAIRMGEQER